MTRVDDRVEQASQAELLARLLVELRDDAGLEWADRDLHVPRREPEDDGEVTVALLVLEQRVEGDVKVVEDVERRRRAGLRPLRARALRPR